MSTRYVKADEDHTAQMHPEDLREGIPTDCETCGLAIHTDPILGILRHGYDD